MATTYALVSPTLADLDLKLREIPSASRSNIDLVSSSNAGDRFTAEYLYNAGPAKDVIKVTLLRNYNAKTDVSNCSLRLASAIRRTVSETGAVDDLPIEAVVAWNYTGRYCASMADMSVLLQAAVALVFKDLVAANGLPNTNTLDAFDRGVLTNLY